MQHVIDARRLIEEFRQTDPMMPILVFALLEMYLEHGPFEFDAAAIAKRLHTMNTRARVNAEQLASLQPELERFFEIGEGGWQPRHGVLQMEAHEFSQGTADYAPIARH